MVDKIPLFGKTLAALQRTSAAVKPETATRSRAEESRSPVREGAGAAAFEQRVRSRIAQISPDDPQRRRRALRIVVEASLLKEFGAGLESDPAFHTVVDQVTQTMSDEGALDASIDTALKGLWP